MKKLSTGSCESVYHRMCLTEIEIFRFIEFHFVFENGVCSSSSFFGLHATLDVHY